MAKSRIPFATFESYPSHVRVLGKRLKMLKGSMKKGLGPVGYGKYMARGQEQVGCSGADHDFIATKFISSFHGN